MFMLRQNPTFRVWRHDLYIMIFSILLQMHLLSFGGGRGGGLIDTIYHANSGPYKLVRIYRIQFSFNNPECETYRGPVS